MSGESLAGAARCYAYDDIEKIETEYRCVFHLAAYIPYGNQDTETAELLAANVGLTLRLCQKFPSARFVYASSVSVYSDTDSERLTEVSPLAINTLGAYAATKLAGELIVRQAASFAVVRFSSIFGPGMTAKTFLPLIIDAALSRARITLFGSGTRRQNYVYNEDAAALLLAVAESANNGLLLGVAPEGPTNQEVAETVARFVPGTVIEYKGEDNSRSYCFAQLDPAGLLNNFTYLPFTEGLKRTVLDRKE